MYPKVSSSNLGTALKNTLKWYESYMNKHNYLPNNVYNS